MDKGRHCFQHTVLTATQAQLPSTLSKEAVPSRMAGVLLLLLHAILLKL
jgi:hypothetical protein